MSREDDNALLFGIGILAGVTAGVIGGLLFAPESGEETRKKLESKINELADNYPCVETAKKQALEAIDVLQYKIEKAIKKVDEAVKAKQLARAKEKEDSAVYGV